MNAEIVRLDDLRRHRRAKRMDAALARWLAAALCWQPEAMLQASRDYYSEMFDGWRQEDSKDNENKVQD
jgi:hypothetical protein